MHPDVAVEEVMRHCRPWRTPDEAKLSRSECSVGRLEVQASRVLVLRRCTQQFARQFSKIVVSTLTLGSETAVTLPSMAPSMTYKPCIEVAGSKSWS